MKSRTRLGFHRIGLIVVLILLAVLAVALPKPRQQVQARLVGLPATNGKFQRADGSTTLSFPKDFGSHDDYQSEWWYYTGNLQAEDGSHYGFQLTFFRRAIQPADQRAPRLSDLAAEQVYMAHFTLTDVPGKQFRYFERFSRGSGGLAGATAAPEFQAWLGNWSVQASGDHLYRLQASEQDVSLDLTLKDLTGPILQGQNGYSPKGPEAGNASYYFSQPDLLASGTVTIAGKAIRVSGTTWMDHEFSTSALGPELVGWDWFSLQLSDGSALMLYQLRRKDGSVDGFSSGTWIRADGSTRPLKREDFKISATASWKSPKSGATYPAAWVLEVPAENLRLELKPYLADQELRVSFTYWEGAVQVRGTHGRLAVSGNGYVELTGYAKSMQGQF